MEQSINQPNPLVSILPLIIIMVPMIFVIRRLAKEKGKDVTLWTILACIPIVNCILLPYIVGTPNKILEAKINEILKSLNKSDQEPNS
jgi:preprotein translocase subunit YajC